LEIMRGGANSAAEDLALRDEVLKSANASKLRQKRVTNECNKLVIDHTFQDDLELPYKQRPARSGTVLGVKSDRLYVQLDEPPLEVKLYAGDIGQVTDERPVRSEDAVTMIGHHKGREVRWRLGDRIDIKVLDYHRRRRRWMLVPAL
jgi:exoribonuclease R